MRFSLPAASACLLALSACAVFGGPEYAPLDQAGPSLHDTGVRTLAEPVPDDASAPAPAWSIEAMSGERRQLRAAVRERARAVCPEDYAIVSSEEPADPDGYRVTVTCSPEALDRGRSRRRG